MNAAQLDAYYTDRLMDLRYGLDALGDANLTGLYSWLKAQETWTDVPVRPEFVRELRDLLAAESNRDKAQA